jgi:hypothetical protein
LPEQSLPILERDDGIHDWVDPVNVIKKGIHDLSAGNLLGLDPF